MLPHIYRSSDYQFLSVYYDRVEVCTLLTPPTLNDDWILIDIKITDCGFVVTWAKEKEFVVPVKSTLKEESY